MEVINSFMTWVFKSRLGQIEYFKKAPHAAQDSVLKDLIEAGKQTKFGKEFGFASFRNYQDFAKNVPLTDYEGFKPYIDRVMKGEQNLIWNTEIEWFSKSSGTTSSRSKYIPVTEESLEECHFKGGKDMVTLYVSNYPDSKLFSGKSLSIGGSLESNPLNTTSKAKAGDISAVIMRNLPIWAQFARTPSLEVALMNEWEAKIEKNGSRNHGRKCREHSGCSHLDHCLAKTNHRNQTSKKHPGSLAQSGSLFSRSGSLWTLSQPF